MKPLLIAPLIFFFLTAFALGQQPASKPESSLCQLDSLPTAIQERLKKEYGSWRVQEPASLSQRARKRWESERPLRCPGIAVGSFERAQSTSYALLLVPTVNADAGYRFVVFSQKPGQSNYEPTLLDRLDEAGAANYFVRGTPISKFFDQASKKRFNAYASDAILLFDSAEKEYEVDVYYWSASHYRHDPVDY